MMLDIGKQIIDSHRILLLS